jgi:hypothetical protein
LRTSGRAVAGAMFPNRQPRCDASAVVYSTVCRKSASSASRIESCEPSLDCQPTMSVRRWRRLMPKSTPQTRSTAVPDTP